MRLLYIYHKTTPQVAQVDDEDYHWLCEWNWFAVLIKGIWYAKRSGKKLHTELKIQQYLHRVVMRVTDPNIKIDHINHDGLDCQKHNLRPCTKTQNDWNQRSRGGSSKYKGVSLCNDKYHMNKWIAQICTNGIRTYIGRFNVEEDAAKAYDRVAKQQGEFANLNFN